MARTKGSLDGRVLSEIEFVVDRFLEREKQVPSSWSQLDEIHDFTSANVILSISYGKPRLVQQEYAILPKPMRLPDGRDIIAIQRLPSRDSEDNIVRRYVWFYKRTASSSTSAEISLPVEVRNAAFPETEPAVVARALKKLEPKLAEEMQDRRKDRIQQVYLLRNRMLSFLFGEDVAVGPDGSITRTGNLILSALVLATAAFSLVPLLRRRGNRKRH